MTKNIYILGGLFISSFVFSQIGINTKSPKTLMDVSVKRNSDGSVIGNQTYGLQAPRLSRAELTSNTATYSLDQNGALIYITSVSGGNADAGTQRENITTTGYYYFDAPANKWQKVANPYAVGNGLTLSENKVKLGGALTEPVTISSVSPANKLSITGSGVDAVNLGGDAFSLDADNSRVGIGSNTPTESLDVNGNARFRNIPYIAEDTEFYHLGVDGSGALSKDTSVSSFSIYLGYAPMAPTHAKVLPFTIEEGYITKVVGTSIDACNGYQIDFTIYFIGTTYQGALLQARNKPAVNLTKDQSVFGRTLEKLSRASDCLSTTVGHTLSYANGQITTTFYNVQPYRPNSGLFVIYSVDKVKLVN